MSIGLRPLGNRVFIKRLEPEEVTGGGIIIPDTAREKPKQGEVIAAGPGEMKKNGSRAKMEVKVDDTVLFPDMHGWETTFGGEEFTVLRESDVLAVMKG